jgi:hypothetical protein
MLWKWRWAARQPDWGTAGICLAAAVHVLAVSFLGIFISRFLTTGNLVIGTGENCGFPADEALQSQFYLGKIDKLSLTNIWANRLGDESLDYARRCYAKTRPEAGACAAFQMRELPFTTRMVPYPFSESLYALPEAFQLDTGYLDSNTHLGVNLPPESRVRFRKIVTYTPNTSRGKLFERMES